jgi:hypothetical protein
MLKVSEMLWNTPKHHFGSNGVEWMPRKFRTPNKCIQAGNTSFSSFYVRRLAKWSKTQPNMFLGLIEYNECIATSIPRNSAFRPETQISHLFTLRRFAKCSKNVPIIIWVLCIFFHSEGFRNAPKHSQWFWDHWSRMDAFVTKLSL